MPGPTQDAWLAQRQHDEPRPACGSGSGQGSYNTSLHVWALVLVLGLSTLGTVALSHPLRQLRGLVLLVCREARALTTAAACSFPIIFRRFPRLPVPHRVLFFSRHFGTGVLIATAFVHLLPTAFVSLTDPCLPPFWNQGYPQMAGLIAMTSVLVVVGIEMFFATRGARHVHTSEYKMLQYAEVEHLSDDIGMNGSVHAHTGGLAMEVMGARPIRNGESWKGNVPIAARALQKSNAYARVGSPVDGQGAFTLHSYDDEDKESTGLDADEDEDDEEHDPKMLSQRPDYERRPDTPVTPTFEIEGGAPAHEPSSPQTQEKHEEHEQDKLLLQCMLLEAGILFHSIFIGMALSVATGTPFIVLLVAISFHQTFEGLALGSRIAAIRKFGRGSLTPWLMALAYGTTTPAGQTIGLLVHKLYDPLSETGLLMVGFMNAISSGLLLFAGLVELLAEDFLTDKSYTALQGRNRLEACAAVVAGSVLMALVGAWA